MPEINGVQPDITNVALQALLVQQYWYDGKLEDPANVVHICVASHWFRLYFDYGVVFWRPLDAAPTRESDELDDGFGYPLVDLGSEHELVGRCILAIRTFDGDDCDAGVVFDFDSGVTLTFKSDDDITSIETSHSTPRGT